jgi:hypothetical protein
MTVRNRAGARLESVRRGTTRDASRSGDSVDRVFLRENHPNRYLYIANST